MFQASFCTINNPVSNFLKIGFLIIFISSCNDAKDSKKYSETNFQVKVVDSLEIDYLGNLWLINYDPASQRYLGFGNGNQELVVLDTSGVILEQFEVPHDGPNSVSMINAIKREIKYGISVFPILLFI